MPLLGCVYPTFEHNSTGGVLEVKGFARALATEIVGILYYMGVRKTGTQEKHAIYMYAKKRLYQYDKMTTPAPSRAFGGVWPSGFSTRDGPQIEG